MLDICKKRLFKNLQTAIELEHSTIPPYLAAMFTINQDTNPFAYQVIRSVVMEEMLHMTLACNVLNALGGSPYIDQPKFIPEYPTRLNFDGRDFDVNLAKFSKAAIETFLEIEKPDEIKLNLKGEGKKQLPHEIDISKKTIGEFYEVVKEQLVGLVNEHGEAIIFNGDLANQIHPEAYYGAGGEIIVVHNLETALLAIDIIVDQGEGVPDSIYDGDELYFGEEQEVAHYFRFNEIYLEKKYKEGDTPNKPPSGANVKIRWDAVKDMVPNPKAIAYPEGSPARIKGDEFNQLYSHFLRLLHLTFNGEPTLMSKAVGMMYQMKYIADELLNIQISKNSTQVMGPPFEYIPLKNRILDFDWLIPELKAVIEKV